MQSHESQELYVGFLIAIPLRAIVRNCTRIARNRSLQSSQRASKIHLRWQPYLKWIGLAETNWQSSTNFIWSIVPTFRQQDQVVQYTDRL